MGVYPKMVNATIIILAIVFLIGLAIAFYLERKQGLTRGIRNRRKFNMSIKAKKFSLKENLEGISVIMAFTFLSYYVFLSPAVKPFSIFFAETKVREITSINYFLFLFAVTIVIVLMIKKRYIGGLYKDERVMLEEIYNAEMNKTKKSIYGFGKSLRQKGGDIYGRKVYRIVEELERCGYVYKTKEGMWRLTDLGKNLIIAYSKN